MALLREIEHGIRVLQWQRTEDAEKKSGWKFFPQRLPLTEAERAERITTEAAADPAHRAPSLEDAKRFLGWEKPTATTTAPTTTAAPEEG